MQNLDIKDFTPISGVNTGDYLLLATASGSDGKMMVGNLTTYLIDLARPQIGDNGNWVFKDGETVTLDTGIAAQGQTPTFKKGDASSAAILWKYESEDESAWRNLVEWEDVKINIDELTEEQLRKIKLNYEDLTPANIAELQKPATEAASKADAATQRANAAADEYDAAKASITQAVGDANTAKAAAEEAKTAAKAAQTAAEQQKSETVSYLNTVKANEEARVSAEAARSQAESARASAEEDRADAEQKRVSAENARAQAESDRKNAWVEWFEDSTNGVVALWTDWFTKAKNSFTSWFGATESEGIRGEVATWFTNAKNAWNSWFGTDSTTGIQGSWNTFNDAANEAETLRVDAETLRANAETLRSQSETARANAENTRREQEVDRVSAEQARASAENTRQSQEATRVSQENARVEAEVERKSAWAAWFENATTGVMAIWNSWFGTSSDTGVQGEWATLKSDATDATTAATDATKAANEATTASQKQTESCKEATDLAEELNAHPQMQGSNGNWWKWNTETNEYEDTGIIARGGGMYPMVRSRRNHVIWYDSTDGFKERIVRRRNHTVIKL